jgi:hypothetical protein
MGFIHTETLSYKLQLYDWRLSIYIVQCTWELHPKAKNRGQIRSLWLGDKVDSCTGLRSTLARCVGVDSGVDTRWDYSQLRHRVLWIRPRRGSFMKSPTLIECRLCTVLTTKIFLGWEGRGGRGWGRRVGGWRSGRRRGRAPAKSPTLIQCRLCTV